MKGLSIVVIATLMLISTFHWSSCQKGDDTVIKEEEKLGITNIVELQTSVNNKLNTWFTTMDSLEAIKMAQQELISDPNVSKAIISNQGISIQYTNGIRGVLFLNPRDGGSSVGQPNPSTYNSNIDYAYELKSLVNNPKYLIIDPQYHEWSAWTDYQVNNHIPNLGRIDYRLLSMINDNCKLDNYASLSSYSYGIIEFSSHGCAWPKEDSISDVYMLTGEIENNSSTLKYWDDLTNENIIVGSVDGANKYFISKKFIEKYNDFSQDTILFLGGFCYSFLGDWPDIVELCADATYVGFDWSVRTDKCVFWSIDLIEKMSDTSLNRPMVIEDWMNYTDIEKSYWDNVEGKNIQILYSGAPTLRLWDKEIEIIPLSEDGAPVIVDGQPNVPYPFKCKVISNATELEYIWDIGDGSEPFTTTDSEIEATWTQSGEYDLSVTVNNKSTGEKIGEESLPVVIIGNTLTWNSVKFDLTYLPAYLKHTVLPAGTVSYNNFNIKWGKDQVWRPGVYANGVFTSTWDYNINYGWNNKGTISLTIDEKTQRITGGTIHAEQNNIDSPDDTYYVIDIEINLIDMDGWSDSNGQFYLTSDEVCNTNYIYNINYEDSEKLGETTYINTLESYSCDPYSTLSIEFRTE